jgi:hypothetical protein
MFSFVNSIAHGHPELPPPSPRAKSVWIMLLTTYTGTENCEVLGTDLLDPAGLSLTLSLLMSYICRASSKARNLTSYIQGYS